MIPLRDALDETFSNWRDDVPPRWREIYEGVTLASTAVRRSIQLAPWTPIFPVCRRPAPLGSPTSAHTFRAFKDIAPSRVRVVVVGQDPYPDIAKATGRSFEQGDLRDWVFDSRRVSNSLRAIVQSAAASQTRRSRYRNVRSGWDTIVRDLQRAESDRDRLRATPPHQIFDHWRRQGMLWLNTTFSISLFRSTPSHQDAHFKYWEPFLDATLQYLVGSTRNRPTVFALWGGWAKRFRRRIEEHARNANRTANVRFVEQQHPVMPKFLTEANSCDDINAALESLDLATINWLS